MRIELIGCTSSGKSTLARQIVLAAQRQGREILSSQEFVLRRAGLGRLRNPLVKLLAVDLLALSACAVGVFAHYSYYLLVLRCALRAPNSWFNRLNVARNALKNVGIDMIVRRLDRPDQIVLADEGAIHTAHYLLVHTQATYSNDDIQRLVQLVVLPDVVVYVQESEEVLIERTLRRGHRRVAANSHESARRFVRRAVEVFDTVAEDPRIAERLLVARPGQGTVQFSANRVDTAMDVAAEIVRSGFDHPTELDEAQPAGMPEARNHSPWIENQA